MIENKQEFRYSIQALAQAYTSREKCAEEQLWSPDLRETVADGIDAMIRQIEREIEEYVLARAKAREETEAVETAEAAPKKPRRAHQPKTGKPLKTKAGRPREVVA